MEFVIDTNFDELSNLFKRVQFILTLNQRDPLKRRPTQNEYKEFEIDIEDR